jgi:hypothetical protein
MSRFGDFGVERRDPGFHAEKMLLLRRHYGVTAPRSLLLAAKKLVALGRCLAT